MIYQGKYIYEYDHKFGKELSKINFYKMSHQSHAFTACFSFKYSIYFILSDDW